MSAPAHIARANGMKGGRPKGRKDDKTIERDKILAAVKVRIMQNADALLNAAKSAALGNQYLFKVTALSKKAEIVTDPQEIMEYIDRLDRFKRGDASAIPQKNGSSYYFISTKEPNVQAIKDLFDRAFGKPTQPLDHTSKGEPISGFIYEAPKELPEGGDK